MEEQITNCDAVINFAAETFVDRSIKDANPFLVSNIRGVFTILEILKQRKNTLMEINRNGFDLPSMPDDDEFAEHEDFYQ